MPFRFYTSMLSQASRTMAAGLMIVGLLLIGFGVIIIALPELFALLAATVFFLAGVACAAAAVKIFWTQHQLDKLHSNDDLTAYRQNVRIHPRERDDF